MKRAAVGLLLFVALFGALALKLYLHVQHSFSLAIRVKSSWVCRGRKPCTLTLGQIFPGEWDRVIVFGRCADQDEISKAAAPTVRPADEQRLIVFMKGGSVLRVVTETEDFESPDSHTVRIGGLTVDQHHVTIPRDQVFVKTKGTPCDDCVALQGLNQGETVE